MQKCCDWIFLCIPYFSGGSLPILPDITLMKKREGGGGGEGEGGS